MKRLMLILFVILAVLGAPGISNATLWDRGGGLIYDDVLNITWLQDANYAELMSWDNAMTWVTTFEYQGYEDWRLPDAHNQDGSGPNTGQDVSNSELGHLFYIDLGNSAGIPLTNSGPFLNVAPLAHIWYATEETPSIAFAFRFSDGDTMTASKDNQFYAWAVRDGDVTPVPEPSTMVLLASGLIGLAGFRKKIKHRS